MKKSFVKLLLSGAIVLAGFAFTGCNDQLSDDLTNLTGRVDALEQSVANLQKAIDEGAVITKVETVTDANNLTAVKVTFDSGVLFASNKYNLNAEAKKNLEQFAQVLKEYSDADVAIFGHTDSTGSDAINDPLSLNRANSVAEYLTSLGVSAKQIKNVEGFGSKEPVADNSTAAGRAQNRRVEVYMYASEAMINAANSGQLK